MKKIFFLGFLSILCSSAFSQIILPPTFNKCLDGRFYNQDIAISSHEIWHTYKSPKELKKIIDEDTELCCGTTSLTKDGLVIQKGKLDTEGSGTGGVFYRIFNTQTRTMIVLTSSKDNTAFKEWCDWMLTSIRSLSADKNNKIYNHKMEICK